MKNKYSVFRELWAVPKYKTLIKLGGYIIFFIIFYSIAALGSGETPLEKQNNFVLSYSTMKKNLIDGNLTIKYKIKSNNEYFLDGTLIDNVLSATLEYDDSVKKIRVEDDKIYQIHKDEEFLDNTLLNDINLIFLFPNNIINILNENQALMKQSDDKRIYSYTIDNKSYSVFVDINQIEKIIILDDIITYTFEYSLIK